MSKIKTKEKTNELNIDENKHLKKVSKAATIFDEQIIFSAYKLNTSVHIISAFLIIISHTVLHDFSLHLERYSIRSFLYFLLVCLMRSAKQ